MSDNGGVIVNIVADMWKGFPMMRYSVVSFFNSQLR